MVTSVHIVRASLAAVILLSMAATGCAQQQHEGGAAPNSVSPSTVDGRGLDWNEPIAFAVQVDSLSAAKAKLSFQPIVPQGLGEPQMVFVSDDTVPEDGRAVALEYDPPSYGKVLVLERLPDVPIDVYDAVNQQLVKSNSGSALLEIDPIRDGAEALVATDANGHGAGIYWLESDSFEIYVTGEDLSKSQVLEIANSV